MSINPERVGRFLWEPDDIEVVFRVPRENEELGGPGSGFFAPEHHGRPGEVGGSRSDDRTVENYRRPYIGDKLSETVLRDYEMRLNELWEQSDAETRLAIQRYTESAHIILNKKLKQGTPLREDERAAVDRLDSIFEHEAATLPYDMTIYRGSYIGPYAPGAPGEETKKLFEMKMQDPDFPLYYQSHGYVSTSIDPYQAYGFAGIAIDKHEAEEGYKSIMWEIKMEKGMKGAPISGTGKSTTHGTSTERERELLLPRDTLIQVDSITINENKWWQYIVRGHVAKQ